MTSNKTPWLTSGSSKREAVHALFADIAPTYDLMNSLMCFRLHHRWRSLTVRRLELKPGGTALDVCCGTGDFSRVLRRRVGPNGTVVGLDFCRPMLDQAVQKGVKAEFVLGDACRLPFGSGRFDAVTVGWGLRNVPDIGAAVGEAHRVLKPGGQFVTLDMARPRSAIVGRLSEAVFHRVVPFLGRLFGKSEAYTYLPKSTLQFLSREDMSDLLRQSGFESVKHRDFFFGNVCMHIGVKP